MLVGPDPATNLEKIVQAIGEAAQSGCDLVALPECALPGYPPLHNSSPAQIDLPLILELNDRVCRAAAAHRIWVILGTIVASSEGLMNSALIISSDGQVRGRYDKLHLMPEDREFFVPGTGVRAFDMPGCRLGVLICYDARFPEPFRYLRDLGATVIVNISNACGGQVWKRPVLEGTYRTRASENSCFLVAVNAAGPLQMAVSRVVGPTGLDLAVAQPDTEEMLVADLDLGDTSTGYYYDRRTDQFEVIPRFGSYREDTL